MWSLGYRVWGPRFRIQGVEFTGFRGLEFRVEDLWFSVFRFKSLEFRI